MKFSDRVAAHAADVQLIKVLLTVIAAPFYVLGVVIGLVLVSIQWIYSAVRVGISDVMKRGADAG
jgi:hypothetical protein